MTDWVEGLLGFTIGVSFWPVAICIAAGFLMIPFVHRERIGFAVLMLLMIMVMVNLMTGWNIFTGMYEHPIYAILVFIGYCFVGGLWSIFKWFRYCAKMSPEFAKKRADFINQKVAKLSFSKRPADSRREDDQQNLEALQRGEVPEALLDELYRECRGVIPSPFRMKARITGWIGFWPWSMAGYIIADLLFEIWDWIWSKLIGVYVDIRRRAYKDIDERLFMKADQEY